MAENRAKKILSHQLSINSLIVYSGEIPKLTTGMGDLIGSSTRNDATPRVAEAVKYLTNTLQGKHFTIKDIKTYDGKLKSGTISAVLNRAVREGIMELSYNSPKGGYGNIYRLIPKEEERTK